MESRFSESIDQQMQAAIAFDDYLEERRMICPVTKWIFAQSGAHKKCPNCPHCLLCDHKHDSGTEHAHFRDSQQMKGLNSRMFPNTNPNTYCHVTLCTCQGVGA